MIWREDCGYVCISALNDPFVHAAYQLCGEFPGLPSVYAWRIDPKTAAREELQRFLASLSKT